MNVQRHSEKDGRRLKPKSARERGHHVGSVLLVELGLTLYVPSATELRAKSDIIRPFCGKSLVDELEFWEAPDAATALMRLIELFGLPNAPEYHDWSDDFMDFKRESCFWEYIFQVNGDQYLFVSHDHTKVTVGCKTTADKKTYEAFFRFIASMLHRPPTAGDEH